MSNSCDSPFPDIESAQEYLGLLSETLGEAIEFVAGSIPATPDGSDGRQTDALRLVAYKLDKLSQHISQSRRLLKDLRALRRLLLSEPAETMAGDSPGGGNADSGL